MTLDVLGFLMGFGVALGFLAIVGVHHDLAVATSFVNGTLWMFNLQPLTTAIGRADH